MRTRAVTQVAESMVGKRIGGDLEMVGGQWMEQVAWAQTHGVARTGTMSHGGDVG